MPTIEFKEPKKNKKDEEAALETTNGIGPDEDYMRRISLPVNEAILDEVDIDQQVVVTIIGTVSEIRNNTSNDYNDKSISVKASSIEVYEQDSGDEEAGMQAGYGSEKWKG